MKSTIGWKEYVSFPSWGLKNIRAKMDTGAHGSALDVTMLQKLPNNKVRFKIALAPNHQRSSKEITCKIAQEKKVKSSNGKVQLRITVKTKLLIESKLQTITISLVNRKTMRRRVLIGRKHLSHFLINPCKTYLTK
jgi:hypothetical protein